MIKYPAICYEYSIVNLVNGWCKDTYLACRTQDHKDLIHWTVNNKADDVSQPKSRIQRRRLDKDCSHRQITSPMIRWKVFEEKSTVEEQAQGHESSDKNIDAE